MFAILSFIFENVRRLLLNVMQFNPFFLDPLPSDWNDRLSPIYAMGNRPFVAIAVNLVESNELLSVHLSF